MRVLLTNDDGLHAEGLQTLRRALLQVPGIELAVVAPDEDRTAVGRAITFRRPIAVERFEFDDGTVGYATDGMPVDCVRFAALGLVDGFQADLVVAGINHGGNLGDDITYSGTVAAAFEGVILGVPGIAVSQQSAARELDFRLGDEFDFRHTAAFVARLVEGLEDLRLPEGTLLNVNGPHGKPKGVRVSHLGKRVYQDALSHVGEADDGRQHYRIYGEATVGERVEGTDLAAIEDGCISLTPLHLDLLHRPGLEALQALDLGHLLD